MDFLPREARVSSARGMGSRPTELNTLRKSFVPGSYCFVARIFSFFSQRLPAEGKESKKKLENGPGG